MREVNRLAAPAILSGIAEPVIALVDSAFIGHLSTTSLAGIGLGSSLFLLFVWVLTQTKTAVSAIVSQHYGAGRLDSLDKLIPQALCTVLLLGILCMLLTRQFSTELLTLYQAKGQVLVEADSYFNIRCLGFPLVLCTYTIFGIFRGLQNTIWAMYISIGAGVLNAILDPLFIFGWSDIIPAMGIAGAAWASLIAQALMLVSAVFLLLRKTRFSIIPSKGLHPLWKKLLGLSSGFILRTMALNLTFFLAIRYATGLGDAHAAAHTIAVNIWLFSSYFIDGYANAGNALAGRLSGMQDSRGLYSVSKRLLGLSIGIGTALGLVYLLIYPFIGGFFSDDPEVIRLFDHIFWMVIIAQPLNAIAFSLDGIFKGLGEARYLMYTLIAASFFGFLPALYIGHRMSLGLQAVWWAFIVFMAIRGVSLWVRLEHMYGKKSSIHR